MTKDQIQGTWYNQHGSRLKLECSDSGQLHGTFASASGLAAKSVEPSEVTGFFSDRLVSFTCNFGRYQSLTAWTGHLVNEEDEPVLETQWQMVVGVPSPNAPDELWRGTWVGSDLFVREEKPPKPAPARFPSHPLPDWP